MTLADIDNTDLDLLLDMEVLDSKIDAASAEQHSKKNAEKEVFIDQFL